MFHGGYFVNIDVVLSPSDSIERWHLTLWKEWILERKTTLKLNENYEDIIQNHKKEDHYNKIDTLDDQLQALSDVGFNNVDCFYKYGIFSIYGGMK